MVYVVPIVYTVRIPFTANGKQFATGDVLTDAEAKPLKLGTLVSAGRLIAEPDPHVRRRGKGPMPTYVAPGAYPTGEAPVSGTITVTYDTDPGDELRISVDADFPGPTFWDFGNGYTSTQADSHATCTYDEPGTYTVKASSTTHEATTEVTVPSAPAVTAITATPSSLPNVVSWASVDITVEPPEAGNAFEATDVTSDNTGVATINWPSYTKINVNAVSVGSCNVTIASKTDPNIKTVVPVTVTMVRAATEEAKRSKPRGRKPSAGSVEQEPGEPAP